MKSVSVAKFLAFEVAAAAQELLEAAGQVGPVQLHRVAAFTVNASRAELKLVVF